MEGKLGFMVENCEEIMVLEIIWCFDLIFKRITLPLSHKSLEGKIWKEQIKCSQIFNNNLSPLSN